MTDFAKGDRVKLKHWGDTATVVALPDEVEAVEGLKGHYRIKLDDAAKGYRYVTPDKLAWVNDRRFKVCTGEGEYAQTVEIRAAGGALLARLTEAEAEALVAALQHALADVALGE